MVKLNNKEFLKTKMKKYIIPILIFVVIFLAIAIPRIGMNSVWTDTGIKIVMEQGVAANPVGENGEHQSTGYPVGASIDVWRDSPDMARYAPITSWLVAKQLEFDNDTLSTIWIAFTWALLALMIYILVLKLTKKKLIALGASFLLSLSMAGIQVAWTLYNTQPIIELLIVFGFYAYIKYRDTRQFSWFALLITSCVIAPLVRELAIIVPIAILATTILERKWDKPLLITMPIILLYNIFPSTIPNLFFDRFVAISQFSRGAPLLYLNKLEISTLGFSMPAHLLLYISPILILLASISVALYFSKKLNVDKIFVVIIVLLLFASVFLTGISISLTMFTILLVVVIAVASFMVDKMLAVWFVISWLPFFWLYNGADSILLAPAIPLAIMIVIWIYKLFTEVKTHKKIITPILSVCLIAGFMALPFNLIAVNKTFSGNDKVTREIGAWLKDNIPQNSIVISNLIHGEELQWYAGGWFDHYYGFPMSSFPYNVVNPDEYDKLAKENFGKRDIYIVAGLSLPSGENHWLLNQKGKTLELEKEFIMSENYPIADPLKTLLPLSIRPYGGAPDLVNEIQVRNVNPFMQQAYARYGIYKLIGVK